MKFGLKESEFIFLDQNLIRPLKKRGLKIYIFGSRTTGKNHPFSDIDILVEGELNTEIESQIVHIKYFFEESNFPFKIDLVKERDLAKSYLPSVLKNRIEV